MKVKSLLTKMGRKRIEEVCIEKGWRLPTFEEAVEHIDEIEHPSFWVQGEEFSPYEGSGEMRPFIYNYGKKTIYNPRSKLHVVVIKQDKTCPSCGHSCE